MKNPLYCSTGTFTGKVNGRNPRLALEAAPHLRCDGLEVMLYEDWIGRLDEIAALYRENGLHCPVVHADKVIGDWMSDPSAGAAEEARRRFTESCRFARLIGAGKIVCHIWGRPESDAHMETISDRCGMLLSVAEEYGLVPAVENCVCVHGSPLRHLEALAARYPGLGITLDTRPAQFHRELPAFLESGLFRSGQIRHIHIGDYAGGYKEWNRLYPIPHPGEGTVDFPAFFAGLIRAGYTGSVTLESPCIRPDGVDTGTLNRDMDTIRALWDEAACIGAPGRGDDM